MDKFTQNSPIHAYDGKIFVSGEEKVNGVSLTAMVNIDSTEINTLGNRITGEKPGRIKITATLTEYRATPWLLEVIKKYKDTGEMEPFDIQATQYDKSSYYGQHFGEQRITLADCIFTGDVPLITIDTEGDPVRDEITIIANDFR